jgi:hypothetical protein
MTHDTDFKVTATYPSVMVASSLKSSPSSTFSFDKSLLRISPRLSIDGRPTMILLKKENTLSKKKRKKKEREHTSDLEE